MNKQINKKLFLSIVSCILLALVFCGSTFAWLIYEKRTVPIDGNTGGIKYVYEVNDELNSTNTNFSITNLAFFDTNELKETKYFLSMAYCLTLEVRNTGNLDVILSLIQQSGMHDATNPGVLCLFSETLLQTIDTTKTIEEIVSENNTLKTTYSKNLNKYNTTDNLDITTLYVYIIGVQPNDAADNTFLDASNRYNFTLRMNCENR